MALYGGIAVVLGLMYVRMPSAFLPIEDQGTLTTLVTLPPGASSNRTEEVLAEVETWWMKHPAILRVLTIRGFSQSGSAQNAGIAFVMLKDWDERGSEEAATVVAGQANGALSKIRDAIVFTVSPPPIRELGNSSGSRSGSRTARVSAGSSSSPHGTSCSPPRPRARPRGTSGSRGSRTRRSSSCRLTAPKRARSGSRSTPSPPRSRPSLGSSYTTDFPSGAASSGSWSARRPEADAARGPRPAVRPEHPRGDGRAVGVQHPASIVAPVQLVRYNGYPAIRITGEAAPGQAPATRLRRWSPSRRSCRPAWATSGPRRPRGETLGGAVPALLALSLLAVFLVLAALYESWSIPAAVLLVVPLGILSVLANTFRALPNDVYFKVGTTTMWACRRRTRYLIVEFAARISRPGKNVVDATLEAVKLRFRPIVTSLLAFILGVMPLALAGRRWTASQRAIGTAVMGGWSRPRSWPCCWCRCSSS